MMGGATGKALSRDGAQGGRFSRLMDRPVGTADSILSAYEALLRCLFRRGKRRASVRRWRQRWPQAQARSLDRWDELLEAVARRAVGPRTGRKKLPHPGPVLLGHAAGGDGLTLSRTSCCSSSARARPTIVDPRRRCARCALSGPEALADPTRLRILRYLTPGR